MNETFSVAQFFEDETYEYVRQHVSKDEAVKAFKHYCTSVGARIGMTKRVIITDSGNLICAEWKYGEGLVFPKPEDASNKNT